jgi:hypothetical protein
MVEWVDVIGPALEGLHFVALVAKGAEQSDSKGRFTASRRCRSYEKCRFHINSDVTFQMQKYKKNAKSVHVTKKSCNFATHSGDAHGRQP